jgi:hypothetical protein
MTLPDQQPPRKARRRGLVLPWLLMLILAASAGGSWYWLRAQAETQLNAAVTRARSAGYEVSWQTVHYGGFPFRLDIEFTGLKLGEPSGWRLAAPSLHTEAYIYRLDHWVAVASDGVVLTRPQGGEVRIHGEALRASLSEPRARPPRITIEGANLQFDPAPGSKPYLLSAARKLDVALRAGPDDQAAFLFHAEGARLNLQGLAGRVADQGEGTIDWTLVFSKASAIHGRDWTRAVKTWAAAGGVLQVDSASLQVGKAVLKTTGGKLSLGSDGRLQGALPASLTAIDGSGQTIAGTVTLSNGSAMLGPLRVGPAPKLF